jgi:hypothetical protein
MTTTQRLCNSFPATTLPDNNDPTTKFQKSLCHNINNCQLLIPKDQKWKYVNLNPTPPSIRGLMKMHKDGCGIRPIVNWTNTPAYKLGKLLTKKLETYIPVSYTFNMKNFTHLI